MENDPKELPLEELEVSVRTAALLQSLPAETVGELLALPKITASRLSAAELNEVFDELGVAYEGELCIDEPEVQVVVASGSVAERWATISAWLDENDFDKLDGFNPPATVDELDAAEQALGCRLPDAYREFMLLANGQVDDAPMVSTCTLLPVQELAERRKGLSDLYDEEDRPIDAEVAPGIRAVEYSSKWIPIGVSARGRDFLCLDLDPAPEGVQGQVILIAVDSDHHQRLAGSFGELLSLYFEQVQRGELDEEFDDDFDEDMDDED